MINKLLNAKLLLDDSNNPSKKMPKKLTPQEKRDWNAYVEHLDKIGMRGKESLDKEGVGFKYLDDYIKANPKTSLNKEKIYDIQNALMEQRDYIKSQIDQGKAFPKAGQSKESIMEGLSKLDAYPGSKTTRYKFPGETWSAEKNKKLLGTEKVEFSPQAAIIQPPKSTLFNR